jgi:hypothetical protein
MEPTTITGGIAQYPEIAALLVLIVGVFAARILRNLVGYILESADRRLARYATTEGSLVSANLVKAGKLTTFWLVISLSVLVALRLLGVHELSIVLEAAIGFVPKLMIGLAIIGAGHLLGLSSRTLVARMATGVTADAIGPRMLHASILVIAVVMGLQQMGIDIRFITDLVLVLVTVVLGGMALAFALGARQHVANIIAQVELRRYVVGEKIRIGSIEGTIVEIHSTGINLSVPEGVVAIPAARFTRLAVTRLGDG